MLVLVVEDEALIRMLVCDLLEEAGYTCVEAANAAEALHLMDCGRCRPDLLVTDFNLGPGLDGKELAGEAARRMPGLPTAFVTGNPECFSDYPLKAWECVIAKPFAGTQLVAALHELEAMRPVPATRPEETGRRTFTPREVPAHAGRMQAAA